MNFRKKWLAGIGIGLCLIQRAVARPFQVEDAVGLTKIVGSPVYSPDGQSCAIVTSRGDLEHNTVHFQIYVCDAQLQLRRVAELKSSSNRPGVENPRWLSDNHTLTFLGEQPDEKHRAYALDCTTGALTPLIESPHQVLDYAVTADRSRLAYIAATAPQRQPFFDETSKRRGMIATDLSIGAILAGDGQENRGSRELELYVQNRRVSVPDILSVNNGDLFKVSPNGRYLLLDTRVIEVPSGWKGYQDRIMQAKISAQRAPGEAAVIWRFYLFDFDKGSLKPLMDAPHEGGRDAIWSPDSRSLVVTGSYAPLSEDRERRQKGPFHFEYNLEDGAITPLPDLHARPIAWDAASGYLRFRNRDGSELTLKRETGTWKEIATPPSSRPFQVVTEEDMNHPPKVWALPAHGERKLLLDCNPQLAGVTLTQVKEIHWPSKDGRQCTGGMYMPTDYRPGHHYPLVIQTHGWEPKRFLPQGTFSSGYAAQSLANHGFVVVQVEEQPYDSVLTPREGSTAMYSSEGLVDELSSQGLIDRGRVGLIGFSRTCFEVKYTLAHSIYRFGAAVVHDGLDAGFFQYVAYPGNSGEFEAMNGGMPYGAGLESWIKLAPGFNLAGVRAALLIECPSRSSALGEWEWLTGFRRLKKPVEMLLLDDGDHPLVRPWHIQASQQATLDWMRFWLLGEEDAVPSKREQYLRWRALRENSPRL